MIDWITCVLPCTHNHKIYGHSITKVSCEGEIDWTTDQGLKIKGSHDSSITIKSNSENELYISGNPAKFLQGHNIFGSDDTVHLVKNLFDKLKNIEELKLTPTEEELKKIEKGHYEIKRIDVNQSYHLENEAEVIAWINAASHTAHMKRRGAGILTGTTLYFGKNSRRSSLKCYSKGNEIRVKGHQLPSTLDAKAYEKLTDYAQRSLRFEARFQGLWLKDNDLTHAYQWTPEVARMWLLEMIGSLDMSQNTKLLPQELEELKPSTKMTYFSWLSGVDMKSNLPKTSFYRQRKELLNLGIDIAITQSESEKIKNHPQLLTVLEAKPAQIPNWAYELDLIA